VSERIRKLVNSGMIVAIDQTRLDTTSPVAAIDEMRKAAIELRMQILKDESKGRRGRPPRIYIITKTGQNQIQRRAEDIKTIATRRIEEAGQEGLGQA
jgi:predicted ArsR family transcriptional regulator